LRKKQIILPISVSILLFAVALIFNSVNKSISYDINKKKIQKIIFDKETQANKLINYFSNELLTKSFKTVIIQNSKKLDNLYKDKKLSILIYDKNNKLKLWSDNIISDYNLLLNDTQKTSAGVYNNHLVEIIRKKIDNKTFIVFIHIKVAYNFKNQFLQNHFIKDFNIPDNYKVSLLKSKNDISFFDKNNNFLFSLIKTKNNKTNNIYNIIAIVLFILSFIFYLLLINNTFKTLFLGKLTFAGLLALAADLFLFRFLMLNYKFPKAFYNLDFFNPQNFASSFWFPSLGDFFINTIFILIFVVFVFKYCRISLNKKISISKISAITTLLITIYTIFYLLIINYIGSILINSNIPVEPYKILDISFYSIVAYFIISILFLSFILILYKILKFQQQHFSHIKTIVFNTIISAIIFILSLIFIDINILSIINFYLIFILTLYLFKIKPENRFSFKILIILIISIFTSIFIINKSTQKEINKRKILVLNLSNQRDLIAELIFENNEKLLKTDKVLISYMQNPFINIDKINKYLKNNYFRGYLTKYDFQTTICSKADSLIIENEKATVNCYNYFDNYIKTYGTKISNTDYYFLENSNGRISYIIPLKFYSQISEITLYIEIDSKLISEELGYPELLLDSKLQKTKLLKKYSYAKYYKNNLITQAGDFKYNLKNNYLQKPKTEYNIVNYKGYSHLIYKANKDNIIILSIKQASFADYMISQSYIFSFNVLIFLLITLFYKNPKEIKIKKLSFNNKIQISILSILLLLFIVMLAITIIYNKNLYEKTQHKIISEKTQSVLIEMEHKFGDYDSIPNDLTDYILYTLTKFSNVFYSDINLYNTNGSLIQTSRPEIIEKGLTSDRMNPIAYRELILNKKSIFVQNENIGKLKYLSSYVPFKNIKGKILAYLNLPYFTKQNQIKQEISNVIATIINLYMLIIVITTIVIILISNKITQPLRLVKNKLKQIKLTGKPELINYSSNDEIGELVSEYNDLALELDQYITKVSKLERETAWRQMAKQIAHEIKNPLTPMKLSVQYLKRSWDNKSDNFNKQISNTTKTLIEQIDTLANIATAFSDFASMPVANNEKLNLIKLINDTIQVFDKTPNCKIELKKQTYNDIFIFTDKNQFIRVLNNLVKNAIQSIPVNRFGKITIAVEQIKNFIIIKISDNGSGIPEQAKEKLFEPNFTTKSSGSGLGLAMVKNIIENANGKIWFETEINKGTTFFIKLPQILSDEQ